MAIVYVKHTGSNTSPYDTWAKAATTLLTATAFASASDTIYVADDHSETPVVDTTYVIADDVRVICANDAAEPPTALATTAAVNGGGTSALDMSFQGRGYFYGMNFTSGTTTANMTLSTSDDSDLTFESCNFSMGPSATGTSVFRMGSSSADVNSVVRTKNCTFTWTNTGHGFSLATRWESIGDDLCASATVPTTIFEGVGTAGCSLTVNGGDLSDITGTLFDSTPNVSFEAHLWGCKLGAGVTVFAPANSGVGDVYLHDCASGDTHYAFAHYGWAGNTVAQNTIYPSGGAKYDGTNSVAWTVTGTNATPGHPYYSPWIDVYHSGTSAITPYLEAVRDGSATKYNDDQVWSEWMAKVTSGSTRATFHTERTLIGTPAALESSALGAGDWTGEGGTAAFMKLRPDASFTPAEIGHIRARVGVSAALAVIVDPFVRGITGASGVCRSTPTGWVQEQSAGAGGGGQGISQGLHTIDSEIAA